MKLSRIEPPTNSRRIELSGTTSVGAGRNHWRNDSRRFASRCSGVSCCTWSSNGSARGRRTAGALLYASNLRGGQKIVHDGDVIITGHVNVGAEVSADGHIVVLGKLQGLAHAGCRGDETASVSARSFESGQVRIGHRVGLIDKSSDIWGKSVVITVNGDEVLLTEWPAI